MTDAVQEYRDACRAPACSIDREAFNWNRATALLRGRDYLAKYADAAIAELEKEVERLTATVDILTRSLSSHVGSASAKKCPVCNGSGGWYDYSRASTAVHGNYQNCHGCGGKGWVTT